jgi:isochorismate hydrolase
MVVDDEPAIVEAMWGGDINRTPKFRGEVEERTGGFRASGCVAWRISGFVEQA